VWPSGVRVHNHIRVLIQHYRRHTKRRQTGQVCVWGGVSKMNLNLQASIEQKTTSTAEKVCARTNGVCVVVGGGALFVCHNPPPAAAMVQLLCHSLSHSCHSQEAKGGKREPKATRMKKLRLGA